MSEPTSRFAAVGVRGQVHGRVILAEGHGAQVGAEEGAAERVVMASVYKLPVLVAYCRAVDSSLLDPCEPTTLRARDRTPGATGISAMADDVTITWRDLARSMIAVSDNAAGDALLERIGLDRVRQALDDLGLTATTVEGGTSDVYRLLMDDTGLGDLAAALDLINDNDHVVRSRAFDPLLVSSTTPSDMTALLESIWTDRAASTTQCAFMRTVMGQQIWPHRIASGFGYAGVRISGKTGTLGPLRHEVAVVQHRREPPIAVAIFTEAARADSSQPRVDAAIGAVAADLVASLRATLVGDRRNIT